MKHHPYFDLWLHDDVELEEWLGYSVEERVTIHEWPLSCVQRIHTTDQRRYIYKVQAPPTLEREFYSQALSPLLVSVRSLPSQGATTAMLMDEVSGPRLSDLSLSEEEILSIAAALVRCIGNIEGDLPYMMDLSTEEGWIRYIDEVLDDIRACIGMKSFHLVDEDLVMRVAQLSRSPLVLKAIREAPGYVHSDLTASNVLVTPDGYRVLDWQRPIKGPTMLDVATLLISLGVDASRHVGLGVVQVYHLLRLSWFAQSARQWLAGAASSLERCIVDIDHELQGLSNA